MEFQYPIYRINYKEQILYKCNICKKIKIEKEIIIYDDTIQVAFCYECAGPKKLNS